MPVNCSVPGCFDNYKKNPEVKFHSFPADQELKYKWTCVIKKGKPITPYTKVCSDHFEVANYSPSLSGLSMVLSKNAIPSLLRLPEPGLSTTEAGSTDEHKPHLNAVRKSKRKTNVRDARNYSRLDPKWDKCGHDGCNGPKASETTTPVSSDREIALMDSRDVGFMPVQVILRTYEDFDNLLETENTS